jgi:arylamine N-acetyltransferase
MNSREIKIDDIPTLSNEQLQLYFKRVKADQSAISKLSPLDMLCEIHRLQTMHIHVSNFAMQDESRIMLERPISPFFEDIFQKIVLDGEHGYCYENNLLLRQVLLTLGYKLNFYNAHIIRNNIPKEQPQHALIMVEIENKEYLVDAGYGGIAPIAVSEFKFDELQTGVGKPWLTTGVSSFSAVNLYKFTKEPYKFDGSVEECGYKFWHYCQEPTSYLWDWKPLYIYRRLPLQFDEFVRANDQVSKDDNTTPFKTSIFETAFINDGKRRISVTQNELNITECGRTVYQKPVISQEKYNKYLVKYLGHKETDLNRKIRDRVVFNHPTSACLQWYSFYKINKQNNHMDKIIENQDGLSKGNSSKFM